MIIETLSNLQMIITTVAGVLGFLATISVVTWRISKAEQAIQNRIIEVEHDSESERFKIRQELLEAKVTLMNDFVKKETFQTVMNNIDARLIRLEAKLDSAITKLKVD